jgi:hypothetical protein
VKSEREKTQPETLILSLLVKQGMEASKND